MPYELLYTDVLPTLFLTMVLWTVSGSPKCSVQEGLDFDTYFEHSLPWHLDWMLLNVIEYCLFGLLADFP